LLVAPLLAQAQGAAAEGCVPVFGQIQCHGASPGAGIQQVVGDGVLLMEVRELPAFTALSTSAAIDVDATASRPVQRVQISGDENIVPLITTDVVKGKLKIGLRKGYSIQTTLELKADLEVAALASIDVVGAASVTASGLAGPGFRYSVSGASKGTLSGRVTDVSYSISGAGTIDGGALAASKGSATIAGSGQITVDASDSLDALITGSGTVYYLGNPVVTKRILGSGAVVQK
jgi:hypothetical protein